jgi:hypothetical protein
MKAKDFAALVLALLLAYLCFNLGQEYCGHSPHNIEQQHVVRRAPTQTV